MTENDLEYRVKLLENRLDLMERIMRLQKECIDNLQAITDLDEKAIDRLEVKIKRLEKKDEQRPYQQTGGLRVLPRRQRWVCNAARKELSCFYTIRHERVGIDPEGERLARERKN